MPSPMRPSKGRSWSTRTDFGSTRRVPRALPGVATHAVRATHAYIAYMVQHLERSQKGQRAGRDAAIVCTSCANNIIDKKNTGFEPAISTVLDAQQIVRDVTTRPLDQYERSCRMLYVKVPEYK